MAQGIDTPELALRLARAIASDISLYQENKIVQGIQNDNLFDVLEEHIEEGRALYRQRVEQDLYDATNFFDQAVVDIIFKRKGQQVSSPIW